jgi:hypothetical protein
MASRPRAASRRNPLADMLPSGYSSAAATSKRSGVSSAIWSRGGNLGVRAMSVRSLLIGGWAARYMLDLGSRREVGK